LAEAVVARAKSRELAPGAIHFDYGAHKGKVSVLESYVGAAGWLSLSALTVEALDQTEDHLLFAAVTTDGQPLDDEVCRRLFTLPGRAVAATGSDRPATLESLTRECQSAIARSISERNARFFEAEAAKLDAWADDMKTGLEREIKDLDRSIREAQRIATAAGTLEEKLAGQRQVRALESERNQKRRSLFDAQDDLERRRDELIASVEAKLHQALDLRELFAVEWRLS
jgi:adenine-specific DNA-methyltransferase